MYGSMSPFHPTLSFCGSTGAHQLRTAGIVVGGPSAPGRWAAEADLGRRRRVFRSAPFAVVVNA